jgi:Tol biopolymer transport system component
VPAARGSIEPFLEDGWDPVWSSDGGRVRFVAERNGHANVYERTARKADDRQLTDLIGRRGRLASLVASDGEYLYFTWREDHGDLWVMDVDYSGIR